MGEEADGRADLYACGVMLYEMLTGRRPFEAQSKVAIVSMHLTQKAMPVTQAAPDARIPPALERIVERAMAKKRDERYASAQELLAALEEPYRLSQSRPVVRAPSSSFGSPLGRAASLAQERVGDGWRFLVRRSRDAGVPFPRAFAAGGPGAGGGAGRALVPRAAHRSCGDAPGAQGDRRRSGARRVAPRTRRAGAGAGGADAALVDAPRGRPRALPARQPRQRAGRARARHRRLSRRHPPRPRLCRRRRAARQRARHARPPRRRLRRRREPARSDVGKPALADLAGCVKSCKDEHTRRLAAAAVAKLGGSALLPDDARSDAVDPRSATLEKLRGGKNCRERRAAALELIASGDKRYLDSLRAARERRGGFLGLEEINGCMRRDLDGAIRKWEAEK